MHTDIWFKAKPYGLGWYPATWQAWLVTLLYLALAVFIFVRVDQNSHSASDTLIGVFPVFFVLTCVLLAMAWWKGEEFRWRWGKL